MDNKWIYIQDKQPEKGKRVLCYDYEDGYEIGHYIRPFPEDDKPVVHIFQNEYGDYISVSYWMELPEEPVDNSN